VHLEGAPGVPDGFFEYCKEKAIPVLGICYGMQMLVHLLGGEVKEAHTGGEYGCMPIHITPASQLYSYGPPESVNVWMSHGDEAVKLPDGFTAVARSEQVPTIPLLQATPP
jgi:GMP synthase (glutamine-hydrolysing)